MDRHGIEKSALLLLIGMCPYPICPPFFELTKELYAKVNYFLILLLGKYLFYYKILIPLLRAGMEILQNFCNQKSGPRPGPARSGPKLCNMQKMTNFY